MRFAGGGEDLQAAMSRQCRQLVDQAALTDAGRADGRDHLAVPLRGTLQQALDGGHLPVPTNKVRLGTSPDVTPFVYAEQPPGGHRLVGAFDVDMLNFAETRNPVDKFGCRRAEHHATRRGHRLDPLGHTDLVSDCRVTQGA